MLTHLHNMLPINVPLVLCTTTRHPQFHVIFDDSFSTVQCLRTNQIPTNWPTLFNESAICFIDEDFSKTNLYHHSWPTHPSQSNSINPTQPFTAPTEVPTRAPLHTHPINSLATNAPIETPVPLLPSSPTTEPLLQRENSSFFQREDILPSSSTTEPLLQRENATSFQRDDPISHQRGNSDANIQHKI
jgi:hypothetical protein